MHDSFVSVLSSGSCGNSFLVVKDGSAVMIDAGLSARELEKRMSHFGIEPSQVEAVILTHEHTDHVRGARRFCSEHGLALHGTRGTLSLTPHDGVEAVTIRAGEDIATGGFLVRPMSVMHLAAEPVALRVSTDGHHVVIASDLGCVTEAVAQASSGAEVLLVEANYDEAMLAAGDYPEFLKRAIRGKHGHLSNADAGMLSSEAATAETKDIVLVHLSNENNTPELAESAVKESLRGRRKRTKLHVSEHGLPSGPYRLS